MGLYGAQTETRHIKGRSKPTPLAPRRELPLLGVHQLPHLLYKKIEQQTDAIGCAKILVHQNRFGSCGR